MIAAAEAEAQKNNWPVSITVVDSDGFVVAMHRMDNTQLGSIPAAEDKAHTSVLFRRPSKAFEDAVASGGIGLRVLGLHGGTVNLIGSGREQGRRGRPHERLCPGGHAGDLGPGLEGLGPGGAILVGGAVIAAEVEQVVDLIVGREEALGLTG